MILVTDRVYVANADADVPIDATMPPRGIDRLHPQRLALALTFDDGPDPRFTPQIMGVLAAHQAKATFFVTGQQAQRFPDVALAMVTAGHEVANHGYSHKRLIGLDADAVQQEIADGARAIEEVTGLRPRLYRPAYGEITDAVIQAVRSEAAYLVLWTWLQDTQDWRSPGVEVIVERTVANASSGDIILMHDGGGDRRQTVEAVAGIIKELGRQGYEFVTLSELISLSQQPVEEK